MMIRWMLVAALAWSGAHAAEPGDLSEAPPCRAALAELERQQAQAAPMDSRDPVAPAARAPVRQAQRAAAVACLRGPADSVPPRSLQPPIAVTPPDAPRPQPITVAPPPPAVPRPSGPSTITTCDAVGCWTNDGTRLQRAGPGLLGSRGLCTTVGTIVTCP